MSPCAAQLVCGAVMGSTGPFRGRWDGRNEGKEPLLGAERGASVPGA